MSIRQADSVRKLVPGTHYKYQRLGCGGVHPTSKQTTALAAALPDRSEVNKAPLQPKRAKR